MAKELTSAEESKHTEQMQDIIGTPPMWLYRWGISLVLAIAVVCIFISSTISYPEAIQTQVKIHSVDSPYGLSTKDSARLIKILVQNNSSVKKDDYLAVLENSTGKMNIKAPVNGELIYAGVIHENEQLHPNQNIFFIVGENRGFYGEMIIPQNDIYKVKSGQIVLIKLRNPADDERTLDGVIRYVTNDQLKTGDYVAEVNFYNQNNKDGYLLLRNGMITDAEIITAKATLFHRLIRSLTRGIK
jgi:multidrug resistance efflux pump